MDLSHIHAFITGGSKGIGFATAKLIRAHGGHVVICARDPERLARASEELGVPGIECDVADERQVIRAFDQLKELLPEFNTLINNAGFGAWSKLVDTTLADLNRVMATNLGGAMLCAREAAVAFIDAARPGNIISISSTSGQRGHAGGSYYCASKFALGAMTECWRAELRQHDIRVMLVHPSEVQTAFGRSQEPQDFNESKLRAEDIAIAIGSMLAMHQRGFITDLTVWATNPKVEG